MSNKLFPPEYRRLPVVTGCFGTNDVGIEGERATVLVVYVACLETHTLFMHTYGNYLR